jgi:anti-anti-sigma regulatory factor
VTTPDQHQYVYLKGPLTVTHADPIAATLLEALGASEAVTIDLSGATGIDVSFLQILIAANKSAARNRKTLKIAAPGYEMLAKEAARCGLPGPKSANAAHVLPCATTGMVP